MMSNRTSDARTRHHVYGQWIARPFERRKRADTEGFVDEMRNEGSKLGASQSLHYQHVMEVIRSKITD
jgi:hypothetical protein